MISVKNITFKYGLKSKQAINPSSNMEKENDIFFLKVRSLELKKDTSLAITGVSGSGKSTFLRLLSGELAVQSGNVIIMEHKLHEMNDNQRRDFRLKNLGMIFQDSPLLDYLSVRDNILLVPTISGQKNLLDLQDLATNCGIGKLLSRYPSMLSEGEKQRVAICRALISSPKVILADEPTSSLDNARAREVTNLLIRNCKKYNCKLIMITHDHSLLDKFDKNYDISKLGEHNA